ncbi:LacI family transcriptional regulator, partial [Salmonella enterica subsp. enterica]|nr:LacI family transcriptional regulator [Salmonella enterica subsp. enterica]
GAAEACRRRGYSLIIAQAAEGKQQMDVIHDMVERNRVDGLLALTFRTEYSLMKTMPQFDVPVMAVNWRAEGFANWVAANEQAGSRLITQSLIDLGHTKIAHISGDPERFNPSERLSGYRDALDSAGIAFDPDLVERGGYSFDEGAEAMNALLDRRGGDFTAVYVLSILSAAGALSALKKRNIAVPQDISMVSFHDTLMGRIMSPSLTTVAYPLIQMGEIAATGLMDILDGKFETFTHTVDDFRLLQGESSAARRS